MSNDNTPPYRVEYIDNLDPARSAFSAGKSMVWDSGRSGAPTVENLDLWRKAYNTSFYRDGLNHHVSVSFGVIVHISRARIVRQSDDEVICYVEMPAFEVA